MAIFKDYYAILKVEIDATHTEIRAAYLLRCKEWHPDKHPNKDTTKIMQDINEAKIVLLDPVKRSQYDWYCQYTQTQAQQAKNTNQSYEKRYDALVARVALHEIKDAFLHQSYQKEIKNKSNDYLLALCRSWDQFEAAFMDLVIWELHEKRRYDLNAIYSLIKRKPPATSTWAAKEINWGRFFLWLLLYGLFQWLLSVVRDF